MVEKMDKAYSTGSRDDLVNLQMPACGRVNQQVIARLAHNEVSYVRHGPVIEVLYVSNQCARCGGCQRKLLTAK